MRVGLSKGFRNGFRKLQWRIAAWTALILLSVQIGGLFLFEHIGRSSALDEVRAQLETGDRVFARLLEQRADDESTATSARRLVGRGRPALPRVGAESVLVYRISAVPVSCPLRLSRTGSGVTLTP